MEQETIRRVNHMLDLPSETDPLYLPDESDEEDFEPGPEMKGGLFGSPLF